MNQPTQQIDEEISTKARLASRLENLFGRINYERQNLPRPGDFKLANMIELMRRLDHPELDYPVIHIAGTKGKGSVCTFVGSILSAAGLKTGVYTSPHLESVHQRLAIDGHSISDKHLLEVLEDIHAFVDQMDFESDRLQQKKLTFFEVITAAAIYYFAKQECDVVVLEVGMGGRLDSTNICQPTVSVITSISLDHTRQLGENISLIAAEKAGIIKPGVPVVSGATQPEVKAVILEKASSMNSELVQIDQEFFCDTNGSQNPNSDKFKIRGSLANHSFENPNLKLNVAGHHQKTNAAIAVTACHVLRRSGWHIPDEAIRNGLFQARLSGRAETICHEPIVIVDMAHNVASVAALVETIRSKPMKKGGKRVLIFAVSNEKDATKMLQLLTPQFDQIVLTRYQSNPRGRPIPQLEAIACEICGEKPDNTRILTAITPIQAWEQILSNVSKNDYVCVTGSAFLVAELRPTILKWYNNR